MFVDLSKACLRKVQVLEMGKLTIIVIDDRFVFLARPY